MATWSVRKVADLCNPSSRSALIRQERLRYGETAKQLRQLVDQLEILMLVEQLQSVVMWCAAFNQLEDREVLDLLVAATPNTPN